VSRRFPRGHHDHIRACSFAQSAEVPPRYLNVRVSRGIDWGTFLAAWSHSHHNRSGRPAYLLIELGLWGSQVACTVSSRRVCVWRIVWRAVVEGADGANEQIAITIHSDNLAEGSGGFLPPCPFPNKHNLHVHCRETPFGAPFRRGAQPFSKPRGNALRQHVCRCWKILPSAHVWPVTNRQVRGFCWPRLTRLMDAQEKRLGPLVRYNDLTTFILSQLRPKFMHAPRMVGSGTSSTGGTTCLHAPLTIPMAAGGSVE